MPLCQWCSLDSSFCCVIAATCRNATETGILCSSTIIWWSKKAQLNLFSPSSFFHHQRERRSISRLGCRRFYDYSYQSTYCRTKKQANGSTSLDACIGRRRRDLTTKIHELTDAVGSPHQIHLTDGEQDDIPHTQTLLEEIRQYAFIGDKGYDADHFIEFLKPFGIEAILPSHIPRTVQQVIDTNLHCDHNKVECLWNRLKHCRRIATRYDKIARNFELFFFWQAAFYGSSRICKHDLVK